MHNLIVASLVALVLLVAPGISRAGDGDVDPTFGTGGFVDLSALGNAASDVAIASDDSLAVATAHSILRTDADGVFDPTFGTGGVLTWPSYGLAFQPDGKLIAFRLGIARLMPSGVLDSTFGVGGQVDTGTFFTDIELLPGGSILGLTRIDPVLKRFDSMGAPDLSFGTNGEVALPLDFGFDVVVQQDGRIIVLARGDFTREITTMRLLADGSVDTSWGDGGIRVLSGFENCGESKASLQLDGNLVIPGCQYTGPYQRSLAVARLDVSGTLDPGFGVGGIALVSFPGPAVQESWANAVAILPDGRLFVLGTSAKTWLHFPSIPPSVALVRLMPDGSLDMSFNGTGMQFGPSASNGQTMVTQSSGRRVVASDRDPGMIPQLIRFGGLICGNAVIEPGEECDDGNFVDTDCCSAVCEIQNVGVYSCADDGDPCTAEICDATGVCLHPAGNDGAICEDDGLPCTVDVCSTGACTHPIGNDGAPCADDGESCTDDVCAGGVCDHPSVAFGTPCLDDAEACTLDICDGGACTHPPVPDSTPCDDGSVCTDGDACLAGVCDPGVGTLTCGANDYACYKGKQAKGYNPYTFDPVASVPMSDAIEVGNFAVQKAFGPCLPADVDGAGVYESTAHFTTYKIKPAPGEPKHARRFGVTVSDRFGIFTYFTIKPDRLLVPALRQRQQAPPPAPHLANHHKCYKVRPMPGAPRLPSDTTLVAVDAYEDRGYRVFRSSRLCLAADIGAGFADPDQHLMCYLTLRGVGESKHEKQRPTMVDEFGRVILQTKEVGEICVPAAVTIP